MNTSECTSVNHDVATVTDLRCILLWDAVMVPGCPCQRHLSHGDTSDILHFANSFFLTIFSVYTIFFSL